MENFDIHTSSSEIDIKTHGGKSFWLAWLIQKGFNVPSSFFLKAIDTNNLASLRTFLNNSQEFDEILEQNRTINNLFQIAVRSSATKEDSHDESFAGHFKSFVEETTKENIIQNIEDVVKSNVNTTQKMGVVIQQAIKASYSGIIFSSNPITGAKKELLVSVTEGMGDQLVSGKISGEDILVNYQSNQFDIPSIQSGISTNQVEEICGIAKAIENELNLPVDIEWCIDSTTNELFILQCRPITSIFYLHTGLFSINSANEHLIPSQLKQNDKIHIRLLAQRNSIDISNAYLIINNTNARLSITDELSKVSTDKRCRGFSTVLLSPARIEGSIVRHFSKNDQHLPQSTTRPCQRYAVRSYQDFDHLAEIVNSIQEKCTDISWTNAVIIQEIFEPAFTGIIKMIDDGFLIEIAKGHFVPKGIVSTSQYIVNKENKLLLKSEIIQDIQYLICYGEVIKEDLNQFISVSEDILHSIIQKLKPLLSMENQVVEFGLIENEAGIISPYLIDLVDDNTKTSLNYSTISSGIISSGVRTGKVKHIDLKSLGSNSLELHFHNKFEAKNISDEAIIFFAETPDIALLELLSYHNSEKIGFVFKQGSVLSHLSILLREKGIPAITINEDFNFNDMEQIKLDATSPDLKASDRISKVSNYVTTYTNPDTDGICSSLAYSYYMNSKGEKYLPVYFGKLDKETRYVLDYLGIVPPQNVTALSNCNQITLVDTHHLKQLSNEINPEKVTNIIDHHTGGNPDAFFNASIQNEQVGAVCTILSEKMKNEEVVPDEKIASIMAFAIISNTLNFTAPSTSPRDHDAMNWLQNYMAKDAISEMVIQEMFKARSDISEVDSETLIEENMKVFEWSQKVGISQLEIANIKSVITRNDFTDAMLRIKTRLGLDHIVFSGIDILDHTTTVVCLDDKTLQVVNEALKLNEKEKTFLVNRILLRKTDFIPGFENYFNSN